MNKSFLAFLFSLFILGCSSDDEAHKNPYLVNERVDVQLDLNLPQYDLLNYPGNKLVLHNYGINGIVIYNLNNTHYSTFELTDPNHPIRDCSVLQVQGLEAICSCNDANVYDIVTGQIQAGEGSYSLKQYRAERYNSILQISN